MLLPSSLPASLQLLPRCCVATSVLRRVSTSCASCSDLLADIAERLGRNVLHTPPQDAQHPEPEQPSDANRRVCRVGLIGLPNAGKSQLTNYLTGTKVTAVSPKAHTTREPHLGAFTDGSVQVVLHDTPGFAGLQMQGNASYSSRVKSAWQTAQLCDVLLFLVDADMQYRHPSRAIYDAAATLTTGPPARERPTSSWHHPPAALILNKTDLLSDDSRKLVLTVVSDRLQQCHAFTQCFHVSALTGTGVPALRKYLLSKAQPGAWPLAAGQATDKGPAELAAELVREKLYHHLHAHLPYRMQPYTKRYTVLLDGTHLIVLVLPVGSLAMKRIVVGKRGQVLQGGAVAPVQLELEQLLGARVVLRVEVLVQP